MNSIVVCDFSYVHGIINVGRFHNRDTSRTRKPPSTENAKLSDSTVQLMLGRKIIAKHKHTPLLQLTSWSVIGNRFRLLSETIPNSIRNSMPLVLRHLLSPSLCVSSHDFRCIISELQAAFAKASSDFRQFRFLKSSKHCVMFWSGQKFL